MTHINVTTGRLGKSDHNLKTWQKAHATPESQWTSFVHDLASIDTRKRGAATTRLMEMPLAELRDFCAYVNDKKTDKSVRRNMQDSVREVLELLATEPQKYAPRIMIITSELLR